MREEIGFIYAPSSLLTIKYKTASEGVFYSYAVCSIVDRYDKFIGKKLCKERFELPIDANTTKMNKLNFISWSNCNFYRDQYHRYLDYITLFNDITNINDKKPKYPLVITKSNMIEDISFKHFLNDFPLIVSINHDIDIHSDLFRLTKKLYSSLNEGIFPTINEHQLLIDLYSLIVNNKRKEISFTDVNKCIKNGELNKRLFTNLLNNLDKLNKLLT